MPKFKSRYRKYKIYKQLRSDITGEILLKYKIDRITVFILKNFEYKLNRFKSDFKKWSSIYSPQNKHLHKWRHLAILNINRPNEYLKKLAIKRTHNTEFLSIFINANLVKKKLMRVWRIKQRQKYIIKTHLKLDEEDYENDIHDKNFISPNSYWNPFEEEIEESGDDEEEVLENKEVVENKENELIETNELESTEEDTEKRVYFTKVDTNFRGLVLNKNNQKFIKLNWLNIQLNERKFAHFYGFKSVPRFKLLQDSAFYCNKLRANGIFKLEGMLSVVALRLNMAPTVYQCRKIVQSGALLVNGLRVLNPTFRVKLLQDISVNGTDEYEFLMDVMYSRLTERKFVVNVPDYIEVNYRILYACFWRYPHKNEIFGPYNFPFGKSPHDWSSSTKKIRR